MFRSKGIVLLVALVVVVGVLFMAGFGALTVSASPTAYGTRIERAIQDLAGVSPAHTAQPSAPTPEPAPISSPSGVDPESNVFEAVYQQVNPSVVKVFNLTSPAGLPASQTIPQGEGSGFVWDTQGHIVTNDHVVRGADKLQVTFPDGTTSMPSWSARIRTAISP